jgi:leucyl aminopeptidase
LVGKGVCFDTGGLDIKPADAMKLMKKDMGGAASVLALAYAVMKMKLPIRLRVLVPAVENSISGNAFRPLDVLQTRKGLTVEVGNTDAEGRLILCDALTEADSDNPELLIDMATLTGAARVALGTDLPALFCNSDELATQLLTVANDERDPMWRLPLHKPYRRMLDSKVADLNNVSSGSYAGAITAALFLQEFVSPKTPWLHIDTMAFNLEPQPGRPYGGDTLGVRALLRLLELRYGTK